MPEVLLKSDFNSDLDWQLGAWNQSEQILLIIAFIQSVTDVHLWAHARLLQVTQYPYKFQQDCKVPTRVVTDKPYG